MDFLLNPIIYLFFYFFLFWYISFFLSSFKHKLIILLFTHTFAINWPVLNKKVKKKVK